MKRAGFGDRIFDALNIMVLLLVSAATLYPFWHELCLSLSSAEEAFRGGLFILPRKFTIEAYSSVFGSDYIWLAYYNSSFTTVVHTVLGVFVTSALAYPLSKKELPGSKFTIMFVLFTMLFSGGMIPTYLTVKTLGLVDSLWALIIPVLVGPYNALVMKSFFASLPAELEESAFIDGANPLLIFFRIILPLSKPVLATVALWIAVGTWNNFFGSLLYLNHKKNYTLPLLLRDIINGQMYAQSSGEVSRSSTQSVVGATIMTAVLPILCLYPFVQKYFVKGVMIGSVKG